mgnify:CR=1 FL=1
MENKTRQDAVGNRQDVVGSLRFCVEIQGLQVGGFSEVTGLQAELEIEEYAEGGVNDFIHRFPKRKKYPPLVLKRGITTSRTLWDWFYQTKIGKVKRTSGSIILQDNRGQEIMRWHFLEAYPIKWVGPEMNATRSQVAVESIEIVHNGLKVYPEPDKQR